MRFLILNADYSNFLRWLYAQHPGLQGQPYEEQLRVRAESLFGVADFYSSNLRKLGHEAWDIRVNNEFIQKAWAKEHGIHIEEPTPQGQHVKAVLRYARYLSAQTPLSYLNRSSVRFCAQGIANHFGFTRSWQRRLSTTSLM